MFQQTVKIFDISIAELERSKFMSAKLKSFDIEQNRINKFVKMYMRMNADSVFTHIKELCVKAYEQVCMSHNKFYRQLVRQEQNSEALLKNIIALSHAHELILIDFSAGCQNADLMELGKLTMKMHFQNIEIVKWLIKHLTEFVVQPTLAKVCPIKSFEQSVLQKQRLQRQSPNHYYRVKQNSMFVAKGIDKELTKMQQQLDQEKMYKFDEIASILSNKQAVEKIQPSQNQHLLFEAVEVISHHSEVFKKLTKANKQSFQTTFKDLNAKPYSKLKGEIQNAMKQKISKANEKLILTIDKYIGKKNAELEARKVTNFTETGVQVNLTKQVEDKYVLEDKKKTQKIKQITSCLNYERMRAEKLEQLMRDKASYYEQKLIKNRFEKNNNKTSEISILKKSNTEMTSISNIKENIQQEINKIEKDSKQNAGVLKKSIKFVNNVKEPSKKNKFKENEDSFYEKSLMRIQLDDYSESLDQSFENKKQMNQLSPQEVDFMFDPKQISVKNSSTCKNLSSCHSIEQYKEYLKSKFGFCYNVYDYGFSGTPIIYRNQSLLTITNMRQTATKRNDSEVDRRSGLFHKMVQSSDRQSIMFPKSAQTHRRGKKFVTHQFSNDHDFDKDQAAMISITNKFQGSELEKQIKSIMNLKIEEHDQEYKPEEPVIKCVTEKTQIKNNFELLGLKDKTHIKSKGRLNEMMTELKRKRKNREGLPGCNPKIENSVIFVPQIVQSLYFNQQNAMEAELQFGVSASCLIGDRKHNKQGNSTHQSAGMKNEEYYQNMVNSIQKALFLKRKKNPNKYYQIQYILKSPLSFLKGIKKSTEAHKEDLNFNDVLNFVRFISNLHSNCAGKPCEHLKDFFKRLTLNIQ